MTPILFGYVIGVTLLLALAAAAIEWAIQGRSAVRHLWTVAIALALVAPGAAIAWQTMVADNADAAGVHRLPAVIRFVTISADGTAGARQTLWHAILGSIGAAWSYAAAGLEGWARWTPRATSIALFAWLGLSLALTLWVVLGIVRLRAARMSWNRITLDGIDVDVSASTGPAVLGFLSHHIVVPAWVTGLKQEDRKLILAHEREHIDAHDPERLAVAIVAIMLMPWNVGLWLCAARLRRAIELDCDSRVLKRFPGPREYGCVLLEVAARGRSTSPLSVPVVGLLRLPSELEQRLVAITRTGTRRYRALIGGGLVAVAAVSVAFASPVPVAQMERNAVRLPPATASTGAIRPSRRELARSLDTIPKALPGGASPGVPVDSRVTYLSSQVDKPAITRSGAPNYPTALRHANIEGEVDAEFTVDTTGRLDANAPIRIVKSTNELFKAAVLKALHEMRFYPGEIDGRKVKQLVQEPFTFSLIR